MTDVNRALAAELRSVEHRRLRALVDRDVDTAAALHADDYQLITPSGRVYSKADYLGDIASGALDYQVFEAASEIGVRVFADAGAVRYQARIGFDPDGSDAALYWHTDLYRRADGRWQAVWSQATKIRDSS